MSSISSKTKVYSVIGHPVIQTHGDFKELEY